MGKSRAFVAIMATGISLAWLLPAQAQFWDWGNRPQRQQQQQYNNNNNWFGGGGGWFGNDRRYDQRQEREAPVDYSRAPASTQKKPEATTPIVVLDAIPVFTSNACPVAAVGNGWPPSS